MRTQLTNHGSQLQTEDPYAELKKAHADGRVIQLYDSGRWHDLPDPTWGEPVDQYRIKPEPAFKLPILGWRYADEKKTVPLGPEDVRCGDEIQDARGDSRIVGRVSKNGVDIFGLGYHTFEALIGFKIRRRYSNDFEPCSKEVPA